VAFPLTMYDSLISINCLTSLGKKVTQTVAEITMLPVLLSSQQDNILELTKL